MAAATDLEKTRIFVNELENENRLLSARLSVEQRASSIFSELAETRKSENESLRTTIAAKNEAIVAKNSVIAAQDKLIDSLKGRKTSPWKRLGDVLIGAAAVLVLR